MKHRETHHVVSMNKIINFSALNFVLQQLIMGLGFNCVIIPQKTILKAHLKKAVQALELTFTRKW